MEKWQEWEELLEWLKEDAKQYKDVQEWRLAQEEYHKALAPGREEKGGMQKAREVKKAGDKNSHTLHLMTVHASKGLEFDYV